jgi:hypothetical protein
MDANNKKNGSSDDTTVVPFPAVDTNSPSSRLPVGMDRP